MIAVRCSPETIQLKDYNNDVNLQNSKGESALMIALDTGNLAIAQLLMKHAAQLNLKVQFKRNELFYAYWGFKRKRNIEIIKWLMNTNIDYNCQQDGWFEGGKTVLHYACSDGNIEFVRLFIEKGANLNIKDNLGKTPLMISLELKHFKIGEILIDNNAELDLLDENGESVWFYLCDFNCSHFMGSSSYRIKNEQFKIKLIDFHKRCLEKLVAKSD
jgi:ankyrin repeat protein